MMTTSTRVRTFCDVTHKMIRDSLTRSRQHRSWLRPSLCKDTRVSHRDFTEELVSVATQSPQVRPTDRTHYKSVRESRSPHYILHKLPRTTHVQIINHLHNHQKQYNKYRLTGIAIDIYIFRRLFNCSPFLFDCAICDVRILVR